MSYENITLRKRNVVMVDGYFYTIDQHLDSLIVKTDDGTQAFSYPLDTILSDSIEISSLEYDGRNFWTLENLAGNDIRIRRWQIDNYVLKLMATHAFTETGSHKYESNAFTVEHYHRTFDSDEAVGQTDLSINDNSNLVLGDTITLGPSTDTDPASIGKIEEATVQSTSPGSVQIQSGTTYAYKSGDPICFTKKIWIFNNWNGIVAGGALYEYHAYNFGAGYYKYPGGAYDAVEACTFYDVSAVDAFDAGSNAICYIKGTNMIFLDPDDIATSFGSMVMDNVQDDNATVIDIYDVTIEGDNVYRLQLMATYYGTTYPFAASHYSYQLSTLNSFITSISLAADPAILPADLSSNSTITAIVRDQFLEPINGKWVDFTDDDTNGYITTPSVQTGPPGGFPDGVAITYYRAGSTANEVRITATVQQ